MGPAGALAEVTRAKVEVFLVVDGRRWQVYDWAEISGAKYPRHHGQHAIDFRGFRCSETGEKRVYRFTGEKEDRGLKQDTLAKQLEEARPLELPSHHLQRPNE